MNCMRAECVTQVQAIFFAASTHLGAARGLVAVVHAGKRRFQELAAGHVDVR
jgi:hypothetical protein